MKEFNREEYNLGMDYLNKLKLNYVSHEQMKPHLEEALRLYNMLYLEKYSKHNPQFTLLYFQNLHENHIMHFQGYTDNNGTLKTFAGIFINVCVFAATATVV